MIEGKMNRIIFLLTILTIFGCSQPNRVHQTKALDASVEPTLPVVEPIPTISTKKITLVDKLNNANSISEMWDICKPLARDYTPGNLNYGAICAATWSITNLHAKDVIVKNDETTPGLVMKNSAKEIGKRICATGSIIEIHEEDKFAEGLLSSYSGNLYHFITVGDTGTIQEHSEARLCGFVLGQYHYNNSGGGMGHATDLVGMWIIPANFSK